MTDEEWLAAMDALMMATEAHILATIRRCHAADRGYLGSNGCRRLRRKRGRRKQSATRQE